MDERLRIGQRIKEIRTEKGITQRQLAEMTGLKQHHISRVEKGTYNTGINILANVATALGKRIDFI